MGVVARAAISPVFGILCPDGYMPGRSGAFCVGYRNLPGSGLRESLVRVPHRIEHVNCWLRSRKDAVLAARAPVLLLCPALLSVCFIAKDKG
jgi:hypothetical protein